MLPLTADFKRSIGPASSNDSRRCEQVAEDRLDLDAREVRAQADVLAEAEREVRVRAAVDAERERIVEDVFVAVRRREVQRELVAGRDRDAAHLAVLGRDAREVADRADPAQDLLDRVRQQLGFGSQLLPLARGARRTRAGRR